MRRRIEDLTSPDFGRLVEENPVAIIPAGSIEQHGPHLPTGTDIQAADLIADALAEEIGAVVVPAGPYGVTPLHRGRPGTVSLRPSTFEAILVDVSTELIGGGIETIVFLNWHEGNTASLDRVSSELQAETGCTFIVAQACYTAQRVFEPEGGKLTHGGSIETLAVKAWNPDLLKLDTVEATGRAEAGAEVDEMRRSNEVYGFVSDVGELDPSGWYGDPHWADSQDPARFAETIASELAPRIRRVIEIRMRSSERKSSE